MVQVITYLASGNFGAMYLLAWNVENWPPTYPDFKTLSSPYNNKEQDEKKYRTEVEQLDEHEGPYQQLGESLPMYRHT